MTRSFAIAAMVLACLLASPRAQAETCLQVAPDGSPQPLCMSATTRLTAIASADGIDGGKHIVQGVGGWRLEHRLLPALSSPTRVRRVLYAGKAESAMQRSPMSLGGELSIGRLLADDPAQLEVGALRGAARIELDDLLAQWDVAIGALLFWDMNIQTTPDTVEIEEHRLAPLSAGLLEMQRSSGNKQRLGVRFEAGRAWSSNEGWSPLLVARAGFERLLITVGHKPLWLYAMASYQGGENGAVRGEFGFKVPLPTGQRKN